MDQDTEPNDPSSNNESNLNHLAVVPYNPSQYARLSYYIVDPTLRKLIFTNQLGSLGNISARLPPVPSCIVPTILSYCDARTLCRSACTCRDWRRLAQCNAMWERLCRNSFGVSADCLRPKPDPTKLLYILTHRSLKAACRSNVNPFTGQERNVAEFDFGRQRIPLAAMASSML